MKEVIAIIRQNMIGKTKAALLEEGFPSFTGCKAMGRGKAKVNFDLVEQEAIEGKVDTVTAEQFSEGHRLIPKRLIDVVVHDEEVQKAVKAILSVNSTGHPGDGKIFVMPVSEAYQVRTGESGEPVI